MGDEPPWVHAGGSYLALMSALAAFVALLLAVAPGVEAQNPRLSAEWTPSRVDVEVGDGVTVVIPARLEVSDTVPEASFRMTPSLQDVVTVPDLPNGTLEAGAHKVNLSLSIPEEAEVGTSYEGAVRLLTGPRTVARPLPVRVTVGEAGQASVAFAAETGAEVSLSSGVSITVEPADEQGDWLLSVADVEDTDEIALGGVAALHAAVDITLRDAVTDLPPEPHPIVLVEFPRDTDAEPLILHNFEGAWVPVEEELIVTETHASVELESLSQYAFATVRSLHQDPPISVVGEATITGEGHLETVVTMESADSVIFGLGGPPLFLVQIDAAPLVVDIASPDDPLFGTVRDGSSLLGREGPQEVLITFYGSGGRTQLRTSSSGPEYLPVLALDTVHRLVLGEPMAWPLSPEDLATGEIAEIWSLYQRVSDAVEALEGDELDGWLKALKWLRGEILAWAEDQAAETISEIVEDAFGGSWLRFVSTADGLVAAIIYALTGDDAHVFDVWSWMPAELLILVTEEAASGDQVPIDVQLIAQTGHLLSVPGVALEASVGFIEDGVLHIPSDATGDVGLTARVHGIGPDGEPFTHTGSATVNIVSHVQVEVAPLSGVPGTAFELRGNGFSPNDTVTSHLQKPDGTEFPTLTLETDIAGSYLHIVDSTGFAPGMYAHWAVDNATGAVSNEVTFEVLPALEPTVKVFPSIGVPSVLFQVVGEGFTPNATVTSHLRRPDGTEFGTLTFETTSNGAYTTTINSSGFEPGVYETWALDDATGIESSRATFTVAGSVAPTGQQINLFSLPSEFSAGEPFHVIHGFGLGQDCEEGIANPDVRFELWIDGDLQPVTDLITGCEGDASFKTFLHNFPDGLPAGPHEFIGRWFHPELGGLVQEIEGVITFVTTSAAPTAAVTPSVGLPGTVFTATGTGFTPNSTVTSHLQRPDGSEFTTLTLDTDEGGAYVTEIDSSGFEPGIYSHWAIDDATGIESDPATFEVTTDPELAGVLVGVVTDAETGNPVSGVQVFRNFFDFVEGMAAPLAVTDADGTYELSGAQVGSETGSLVFVADGYFRAERGFEITLPLPSHLDVVMSPSVTVLEGVVRDAVTGDPIQGAEVRVGSFIDVDLHAPTDADGRYQFEGTHLPDWILGSEDPEEPGGFFADLHIQASGYLSANRSFFAATPFPHTADDIHLIPVDSEAPGPAVVVSPGTGTQGTQFTAAGNGFTSDATVTSHLQRPDGTEFSTLIFETDGESAYVHTIDSTGFEPGVYSHWAIDDTTGATSNVATFEVLADGEVVIPLIQYEVHMAEIGWEGPFQSGEVAGTPGGNQIEAIAINLFENPDEVAIRYRVHVAFDGWQDWRTGGEVAGTTGEAKGMEAIEIELVDAPGLSVEYDVWLHGDDDWQGWVRDGQMSGITGEGTPIEAIRIRIIASG